MTVVPVAAELSQTETWVGDVVVDTGFGVT